MKKIAFNRLFKITTKRHSFNFILDTKEIQEIKKKNMQTLHDKLTNQQIKKIENLVNSFKKLYSHEIVYIHKKLLKKNEFEINPIIQINKKVEGYLKNQNNEKFEKEKLEIQKCLQNEKVLDLLNFKFGAAPTQVKEIAEKEEIIETKPEQTIFNISVASFDSSQKLKIIKEIKAILGIGLKEAKDLVEKVPFKVKEGVSKNESEDLKTLLEKIGCVVEII